MGPREEIAQYLMSLGYNNNAIAAIIGNIDVETDGTFDYQKKQNDGGPGRGLFQMEEGDMFAAYQRWLEANSKQDSMKSQLDYMDQLLKGTDKTHPVHKGEAYLGGTKAKNLRKFLFQEDKGTKASYKKLTEQMTIEFMKKFENPRVPHADKRLKSADEFRDKLFKETGAMNNFIQDHQRKENLVALMNAEPAQLEAYHRGMYDSQRFLQQSVAGGDSNIDYSILGDLLETDDYYKFEMDLSGALPIDKDTQINLGGTTFRGKSGGFDPSTRLRGGVSTKIGKDTKLSIYGEKTRTTNNIGFEIKGKY